MLYVAINTELWPMTFIKSSGKEVSLGGILYSPYPLFWNMGRMATCRRESETPHTGEVQGQKVKMNYVRTYVGHSEVTIRYGSLGLQKIITGQ